MFRTVATIDSATVEVVESHVIPVVRDNENVATPTPVYSGATGAHKVTTRKRSKNYKADTANGRAIQVVKSWLGAVNVETLASNVADFAITSKTSQRIEVVVATDDTAPRPLTQDALVTILAPEVTHPNRETAFKAFHKVTEAAGLGKPTPVDRGSVPDHRLSFQDDFELVAMRHCEFRNAPNPQPGELEKYDHVVMNVCWWVYRINKSFFDRLGYEVTDLKSYAQVFAINFLHKYKIDDSRVTNSDNERLMTNHLKQRLVELVNIAKKKAKNIYAFADTASIATLGVNSHEDPSIVKWEEKPEDEEYRARKTELNLKSERTRRTSAAKLLEEKLATLSHEDLITTLTLVQKSDAFCPETREEAAKRLKKHMGSCSECETQTQG